MIGGTVFVVAAGPRLGSIEALTHLAHEVVADAAASMRLDLLAGIGQVVGELGHLAVARHDAGRVISLLRARPELGPVAAAEVVSDQLVLARLGRLQESDGSLVPRRARAVTEHDRTHGTTYGQLLLTYFDALRDVGRSAERLSMHPNTVRYRLRRAQRLFDLDLADADQVLALWLALRGSPSAVRQAGT
jgi:DNA-binding PucR family transcriptional regulator